MYVPAANTLEEAEARSLVDRVGTAWMVTNASAGPPAATFLPVLWEGATVVGHVARANPHWRSIADGDHALMVVTGPSAYVSPSWYASKSEHGRVVPTWNYLAVHLTGTVHLHHDPAWLLGVVTALTERHEAGLPHPWQVTDAPADHIAAQLRGIVGVELRVERVEGKSKLSQNRSAADRAGVVEGLRTDPSDPAKHAVAEAMLSDDRSAPAAR